MTKSVAFLYCSTLGVIGDGDVNLLASNSTLMARTCISSKTVSSLRPNPVQAWQPLQVVRGLVGSMRWRCLTKHLPKKKLRHIFHRSRRDSQITMKNELNQSDWPDGNSRSGRRKESAVSGTRNLVYYAVSGTRNLVYYAVSGTRNLVYYAVSGTRNLVYYAVSGTRNLVYYAVSGTRDLVYYAVSGTRNLVYYAVSGTRDLVYYGGL
jgi:hypothetical protein